MITDKTTDLYGVAGYPLSHTLSPAMHNEAFRTKGINAIYLPFETRDIEGAMRGMKALGIRGMSITMPHKSSVIPFLDEVDGLSRRIHAVNTVRNDGGHLIGYNTDAFGALQALKRVTELSGKTCLLIGAGGTARAIGFILKENGVKLTITNRSEGHGKSLAFSLECPFIPMGMLERVGPEILIQTTPLGMAPHEERSPVEARILRRGMVVMDVIYNPLETRLLRIAREKGCLTVRGIEMFIHQGAEQFRLWTGLEPPLEAMTGAVERELLKGEINDRDSTQAGR